MPVLSSMTARLNGSAIAEPTGGKGPVLPFNLGTLAANADVRLTYRVLVGPGSALGNAFNHAVAVSGASRSNVAIARVVVRVVGEGVSSQEVVVKDIPMMVVPKLPVPKKAL